MENEKEEKQEEKSLIQQLAANFFSDAEILLAIDQEEFTKGEKEEVERERIISENLVRTSIMQMAEAGSTPAQAAAVKMIEKLKRLGY